MIDLGLTALYLAFAGLAGAGFYRASPHQRLWRSSPRPARMRIMAVALALLSLLAAIALLGVWAGFFAALTAVMLVVVALPYMDVWLQLRRAARDVG